MDDRETLERAGVVAGATKWIHTRWHHHSAVLCKGEDPGGIDCAHLLLEAHVDAKLVRRFKAEHYPHDWHMHRDEERFLAKLEQYAKPVGDSELSIADRGPEFTVLPGNILIWRHGRTFSHGAIVSDWPKIIHASFPAQCCLEESVMGGELERKPCRVYSYWGR
jgi:cell wall-associated NlpC family hydrolase